MAARRRQATAQVATADCLAGADRIGQELLPVWVADSRARFEQAGELQPVDASAWLAELESRYAMADERVMVDECVAFSAETGRDCTDLRGQVLPFIRLRELFQVAAATVTKSSAAKKAATVPRRNGGACKPSSGLAFAGAGAPDESQFARF